MLGYRENFNSGCGTSGWNTQLGFADVVLVWHTTIGHVALIGFAFALALEFVFFFSFFSQLLLAFFIGVIGSCHSMLS